jgi:hypothetical protein
MVCRRDVHYYCIMLAFKADVHLVALWLEALEKVAGGAAARIMFCCQAKGSSVSPWPDSGAPQQCICLSVCFCPLVSFWPTCNTSLACSLVTETHLWSRNERKLCLLLSWLSLLPIALPCCVAHRLLRAHRVEFCWQSQLVLRQQPI